MNRAIFLILLLLFTACDEKTETTTVEKEKISKVDRLNLKEKREEQIDLSTLNSEDILNKIGFDINGEKVTIDLNRTNEFIKKMEIEMHGRADEIERKIEDADINFSKGFGIDISDEKVSLDLNKTRDMLQQINILMKDILLDANSTIH